MKPEANFRNKIHNKLSTELYKEGMANPYRGGTPDNYYEGNKDTLWVEYKYIEKLPVRKPFDIRRNDKLSKLQQDWLKRAHSNGVNTAVIVGVGSKNGIILPGMSWDMEVPSSDIIILTIKEIADWVSNITLGQLE